MESGEPTLTESEREAIIDFAGHLGQALKVAISKEFGVQNTIDIWRNAGYAFCDMIEELTKD